MALEPITNYPETTEATENDYIPIETPTGLKKINALNIGGGGADDYVVSFTITESPDGLQVTADHTPAEVYAAYQQGKNIKGIGEYAEQGLTIIFYFTYILMEDGQLVGVSFYTFGLEGGLLRIGGFENSWDISTLS